MSLYVSHKLYTKLFFYMSNGLIISQRIFLIAFNLKPNSFLKDFTSESFFLAVQEEFQASSILGKSKIDLNYTVKPFGDNTIAAIFMACFLSAKLLGKKWLFRRNVYKNVYYGIANVY